MSVTEVNADVTKVGRRGSLHLEKAGRPLKITQEEGQGLDDVLGGLRDGACDWVVFTYKSKVSGAGGILLRLPVASYCFLLLPVSPARG